MGEGNKYQKRKEEGKISVWIFEKVIRNHTVNYFPKYFYYMYVHTYIYSPSGLTMLSPKATDYLTKILMPGIRSPLLSCQSGLSRRLPKHYRQRHYALQAQDPGAPKLGLT